MNYTELSEIERAAIQSYMDVHRPLLGEVARVFARIGRAIDAFDATVAAAFAKLEPDTPIGATTGLAGAQPLTNTQVSGTVNDFRQAVAAFNTDEKRRNYIRAAGIANTL